MAIYEKLMEYKQSKSCGLEQGLKISFVNPGEFAVILSWREFAQDYVNGRPPIPENFGKGVGNSMGSLP